MAQGGGRREGVVLATKVYGRMGEGPNQRGLSALAIQRECEASLRRLRTDCIDLYQMHHVERETPWDEIWQAMERLVGDGKILYVGSSNFAGWDIATANLEARSRHFLGLVSEQSIYHLANRTVELEVIPACRYHGLAVLPWSPLGGGMLGGRPGQSHDGRRTSEVVERRTATHAARLDRWEALCRELGREPAEVALAWLLHQPDVTSPIIGPRTMDQLESCLRAQELQLDGATLHRLDEIWPGPGGEAPKAYAW
jgi:aryl-alcohol dehydrogenase-like predicted oxidoreductase